MSGVSAERLERQRQRVATLERRVEQARSRAQDATPGDGDPGVLSGVRRRPNVKAERRRYAAYDNESILIADLALERIYLASLEQEAAREAADAASQAAVDLAAIEPGNLVRSRHGWHRVVRVNAKTVAVETPWSWTERIPLDAILEVRAT